MRSVHPHLRFPGSAEEAFHFYRSVFGGEFTLQRYRDTPMGAGMPPAERDKVAHAALPLVDGTMLLGADICPSQGQQHRPGDNVSICLETDSDAETIDFFTKLAAGGSADLTPRKMFWGAFFAMCTDRFGVQWMMHHSARKAGP